MRRPKTLWRISLPLPRPGPLAPARCRMGAGAQGRSISRMYGPEHGHASGPTRKPRPLLPRPPDRAFGLSPARGSHSVMGRVRARLGCRRRPRLRASGLGSVAPSGRPNRPVPVCVWVCVCACATVRRQCGHGARLRLFLSASGLAHDAAPGWTRSVGSPSRRYLTPSRSRQGPSKFASLRSAMIPFEATVTLKIALKETHGPTALMPTNLNSGILRSLYLLLLATLHNWKAQSSGKCESESPNSNRLRAARAKRCEVESLSRSCCKVRTKWASWAACERSCVCSTSSSAILARSKRSTLADSSS